MAKKIGLLLEAEVNPNTQPKFETRYHAATGVAVTPGATEHYQSQVNKWGAELRIYFNDPDMAKAFEASGAHVEERDRGYKSGEYKYRVNNEVLWWEQVEGQGLRLGPN